MVTLSGWPVGAKACSLQTLPSAGPAQALNALMHQCPSIELVLVLPRKVHQNAHQLFHNMCEGTYCMAASSYLGVCMAAYL